MSKIVSFHMSKTEHKRLYICPKIDMSFHMSKNNAVLITFHSFIIWTSAAQDTRRAKESRPKADISRVTIRGAVITYFPSADTITENTVIALAYISD